MQARKRAKPVKFGSAAKKEEEKHKHSTAEHEHHEVKEHTHHTHKDEVIKKAAEQVETAVKEEKEPVEESVEVTVEKVEEDHSREDKELAELVHAAAIRKAEALKVESPEPTEKEELSDNKEEEIGEGKAEESHAPEEAVEERGEQNESLAESEDRSESREQAPIKKKAKKNNLVLYFVLVTVVTFLVGLGLILGINYGLQNNPTNTQKPAITLKDTATPSPSAVPTKAVDLSAYNIEVLNGSGVTGAASRVKTSLVTEGFKVTATANAASSDFTKTKIQAKSTVNKDYLDKLQEFLNKTYVVDAAIEPLTGPSDQADVIVTIGTETK